MTTSAQVVACPQCSADIELFHRPVIDAALLDRFLSKPLNPSSCPGCGLGIEAQTPCLVTTEGFTAIVLANPEPIGIGKAAEVVDYFLRQAPHVRQTKQPLLVVGREEQLRRILRRAAGERFNAVPFAHFLCREWEPAIEQLKTAADSCMAAGRAEAAYWWLIEAVGFFNELYLLPVMRESLEMAVLAAGDRIAPNLKEPRTAREDFERVQTLLEPMVPLLPDWFDAAYLCFFDDDRHFAGHPSNFLSELCRLNAAGGLDLGTTELHLNFLAPQAIGRVPLLPVEAALIQMLALMELGELPALGVEIAESDVASVQTIHLLFRTAWNDLLSAPDRYRVYKEYERLTGGKDIRLEWDLPSHGLTFTIDRMESGHDPRFA